MNNTRYIKTLLIIIALSLPSVGYSADDNANLHAACKMQYGDVINYLHKQSNKNALGLIIDVRRNSPPGDDHERIKDAEEELFYKCLNTLSNGETFLKLADRRHLRSVLDERKLPSSGITDSEMQKLGRIMNIDFILLETLYDDIMTQKLLNVDTGAIIAVKTVALEKKKDKWVQYFKNESGDWYYNTNYSKTNQNIVKVWNKVIHPQMTQDGDKKRLDYTKYLREIDCQKGTLRYLSQTEYNEYDEILKPFPQNQTIYRIIPGTNMGILQTKICP